MDSLASIAPLFVFIVVRSLGACAVIAVTIGHACLTGWLLARLGHSLACLLSFSLSFSHYPRYTGARQCTECTLLHVAPPTRPLPMYHLSTCATVRNCPPLHPFSSSSSSSCFSLLFCRFVLRFLPVNRSSVHLDSSFCSRFSRSCWPFAPIHSPCTSLFDSTRGYIGFFCLLLRGCFLLASLSRLIIVLPARCLLSPAPHLHLSRSLNPHT